jgi:hypothetical protein
MNETSNLLGSDGVAGAAPLAGELPLAVGAAVLMAFACSSGDGTFEQAAE